MCPVDRLGTGYPALELFLTVPEVRMATETTRFGGMLKNSVAERALRLMKMKIDFRHRNIFDAPIGISRSRPRK